MSPISTPPSDLDDFPDFLLRPSHVLIRIHRRTNRPWWFSSSGSMRFDLTPPGGTCYIAESDEGAFLEALQESTSFRARKSMPGGSRGSQFHAPCVLPTVRPKQREGLGLQVRFIRAQIER